MTDDERAAFERWLAESALCRFDAYVLREAFAAGIAYAQKQIAQARADALEACAKICDERAEWLRSNGHTLKAEQSETLAAAIRARKDGQ